MNATTPVIISMIGLLPSIFTCVVNISLLKQIERKKKHLILFKFRFFFDVILGASVVAHLGFYIILTSFYDEFLPWRNMIFYLSLISWNIGAARSLTALTISVERVMAVYVPIIYRNYRPYFPIFVVPIFAISFGASDIFILFNICDYEVDVPDGCAALGCCINACFNKYYSINKGTTYILTVTFAMLLSSKLFFLKNGSTEQKTLSKANLLTLIDAANVIIFDFSPILFAFLFKQWFTAQNIGPIGVVSKMWGCAIEALLVFGTFRKTSGAKTSTVNVI